MRSAVIGIGVNVEQKSFPEELALIATSLSQCGIVTEVNSVRDSILNILESELYGVNSYEANQNSILDRLRTELAWMSNLKSLRLTNVDGSVLTDLNFAGINDSGALLLQHSDGSAIVAHSGSLSWDN
jgi:biotin-(acetyl-CoA carboxylase) ligase